MGLQPKKLMLYYSLYVVTNIKLKWVVACDVHDLQSRMNQVSASLSVPRDICYLEECVAVRQFQCTVLERLINIFAPLFSRY